VNPSEPQPSVSPAVGLPASDEPIRDLLRADERLLEPHRMASISVVHRNGVRSAAHFGSLYLTDRRLIHLNGHTSTIELSEIAELGIARHRLLLSLKDATGVILDLEHATAFRARVAAALGALRSR